MSLEREGLTSRGFENIVISSYNLNLNNLIKIIEKIVLKTLFGPLKVNSKWTHNNFNGFWTQKVSSSMAGEKYLCKGQLDRYMKEQDEVFDVLVSGNLIDLAIF